MKATGRTDIVRAIERAGVVAVVRLQDGKSGRSVARALADGGVTAIEITMTVPNALELIAELVGTVGDVIIGAGTVLDSDTAERVVAAGARFVVSPIFKQEVVDRCHELNVAAIPGCFSPTEIFSAWESGADIVKVFPATALGPAYFKDLRGPLPDLRLMPTGGVTRENAADWIRAGAVAIGVGTALVDPALVASERFDAIADRAREFVAAVRSVRTPKLVGA